ncbi:testis-expressed protein 10 [Agrilus planipennis]|uniref:Testis-expressed protein 10 n=1 Tax=Agrilus planipennis TaxID=224129 RepID=A0A7F5R299_AGRPL|nr:testis-expressed protein 10 [Agrilus planipennis]
MAKSHKTKKHLKSEKSKTKLKGRDSDKTKFLPKGANVTNVNFKIKQIVVPEQLKTHGEDEIVSKRKLNIKDLLSRLKHYNTNIKSDALQDLIEVFSSYKEEPVSLVIKSYISQILQNTCSLILDKEKNVRQKAIKFISLILSTVEKEKIFPFSNIILSHLKCAMTDINKSIQGDSLLLLDSLVTDFPQVVTEYSEQILPIFFILISNVQSNLSSTKTLQLNLQGTSTSTKWRLQVLNRLQKILIVIVRNKIDNKK